MVLGFLIFPSFPLRIFVVSLLQLGTMAFFPFSFVPLYHILIQNSLRSTCWHARMPGRAYLNHSSNLAFYDWVRLRKLRSRPSRPHFFSMVLHFSVLEFLMNGFTFVLSRLRGE